MADFETIVRTAFAGRQFTDEPVTDADVGAILDIARFASSGGNQQGWRVVVIREPDTKRAVITAGTDTIRRYVAQQQAGERGFNTVTPTTVTTDQVAAVPDEALGWYYALAQAPVLFVVGVDLALVASVDADLDRVGVVSGGSIYPFIQNLVLAAHARGLAGVLTTFAVGGEDQVKALLSLPEHVAIAGVIPLGHPTKRLTRLSRHPVEAFARWESWAGRPVRSRPDDPS